MSQDEFNITMAIAEGWTFFTHMHAYNSHFKPQLMEDDYIKISNQWATIWEKKRFI